MLLEMAILELLFPPTSIVLTREQQSIPPHFARSAVTNLQCAPRLLAKLSFRILGNRILLADHGYRSETNAYLPQYSAYQTVTCPNSTEPIVINLFTLTRLD